MLQTEKGISKMPTSRGLVTREEIFYHFFLSGKRFYGKEKGLPVYNDNLLQVIGWMQSEVPINKSGKRMIADIYPGGGRWTYTFLDTYRQLGFPQSLEYNLFGSVHECNLAFRDGAKFLDYALTMRKECRIRAYPIDGVPPRLRDPNLICAATFNQKRFDELFEDEYQQDKYDTILCFDAYYNFQPSTQRNILRVFNQCLGWNGTAILEIPKQELPTVKDYLAIEKLTYIGICYDGPSVYLRIVKN